MTFSITVADSISIHAPAMGATVVAISAIGIYMISIHAPAMGATWTTRNKFTTSPFQSTRPRWARREGVGMGTASTDFNPRARDGRDTIPLPSLTLRSDFNPRARDGRDSRVMPILLLSRISIHAPAMGATPCMRMVQRMRGNFNPRARDGRDRGAFSTTRDACHFNPRARDGRDALGLG